MVARASFVLHVNFVAIICSPPLLSMPNITCAKHGKSSAPEVQPSKSAETEPARSDGMCAFAQSRAPKAETRRITCMSSNTLPDINFLKPTGHVMHQQFNIQQLYVLPALYLCFVFI